MNLGHYDVEIAFKEGFCTIFVANGSSPKKVNWVHLDYKKQNFSSNHMPLMKKTLNSIDINVAVSEVAAQSYEEVFNLKQKVLVIHNIIQSDLIRNKYEEEVQEEDLHLFNNQYLTFISVGRLVSQKGYDRLINIHKRLIQEGLMHNIIIIGHGEDEDSLRQQINELGCQETCRLIGYRENPFAYFKLADCFLLPSRYEGLPTVVFESLICETPVIATKVAGVEEQLNQTDFGLVVDNENESFYEAMKHIIGHPTALNKMKVALKQYQYQNDKIISQIKELVEGKYER